MAAGMTSHWIVHCIALKLLLGSVAVTANDCVCDTEKRGSDTFYYCPCEKSWHDANDHCKSLGGLLAKVDTQETQNYLAETLKKKYYNDAWIGGKQESTSWQLVTAAGDLEVQGQGCFWDKRDNPDLPFKATVSALTPEVCVQACKRSGYRFAGVQDGDSCYCGNSYGKHGEAEDCREPCAGDMKQYCGGKTANYIIYIYGTHSPWAKGFPRSKDKDQILGCGTLNCDYSDKGPEWTWRSVRCNRVDKFLCSFDYDEATCKQKGRDYFYVDGMCAYFDEGDMKNWFDSRLSCEQKGGKLLSVPTEDVHKKLVDKIECWHTAFWVGVAKIQWTWATNEPLLYTKWAWSEPEGSGERCLYVSDNRFSNYNWGADDCSKLQYFVCQDLKVITETTKIPTARPQPSSSPGLTTVKTNIVVTSTDPAVTNKLTSKPTSATPQGSTSKTIKPVTSSPLWSSSSISTSLPVRSSSSVSTSIPVRSSSSVSPSIIVRSSSSVSPSTLPGSTSPRTLSTSTVPSKTLISNLTQTPSFSKPFTFPRKSTSLSTSQVIRTKPIQHTTKPTQQTSARTSTVKVPNNTNKYDKESGERRGSDGVIAAIVAGTLGGALLILIIIFIIIRCRKPVYTNKPPNAYGTTSRAAFVRDSDFAYVYNKQGQRAPNHLNSSYPKTGQGAPDVAVAHGNPPTATSSKLSSDLSGPYTSSETLTCSSFDDVRPAKFPHQDGIPAEVSHPTYIDNLIEATYMNPREFDPDDAYRNDMVVLEPAPHQDSTHL